MDSMLTMGVDAATGNPLPESIPAHILDSAVDEDSSKISGRKDDHLGAAIDDANDLSQAGWAVLFPGNKDCSAIKNALKPLLTLREGEAGTLFKIFEGDKGYQPGDTAEQWLRRFHRDLRMVDPTPEGIPYYVLIVGSPQDIPFEFQYKLDSYWAVGRLYFDTPEEYGQYAAKAVAAETQKVPKTAAVVATRHKGDFATQLLHDTLAVPLIQGADATHPPLGSKPGFAVESLLADNATKKNILELLAKRPSLLFTGTHGLRFDMADPDQTLLQGALLCADFPQLGKPPASDSYLCGKDVTGMQFDGMIHFCFACYSAGCPANDTYDRLPNGDEKPLMKNPIVAKLPQALLSGGALAVVGHIDRAWASSFKGAGSPQIQEFRFTLDQILRGVRVGQAMDQFNQRWSVLSSSLSDILKNRQLPGQVSDEQLTEMWKIRNDARNYVILGDPAARLNV